MVNISKFTSRALLDSALVWPAACLLYLDRLMTVTMRGLIKTGIAMSDAQFRLLSPSAGFLVDRFSRSKVIIGSLFVQSAVTWLPAPAQRFNQLIWAFAPGRADAVVCQTEARTGENLGGTLP